MTGLSDYKNFSSVARQPITVSLQQIYSLLFKVILKELHKQPLL